MEEHFVSIALSIAGPALLGIFGYMWRVNSRLTSIEKQVEAHQNRINANAQKLHSHFEKAFTIRKNID